MIQPLLNSDGEELPALGPSVEFPFEDVYRHIDGEEDGVFRVTLEQLKQLQHDAKLEGIEAVLRFIVEGATVRDMGSRAMLCSYLVLEGRKPTQRAIAKRLNVTPARVCQILREAQKCLAAFNAQISSKPKRAKENPTLPLWKI